MQAQPQTRVLRELGGGWLECLDAQGMFYFNEVTKQSSDEMPPELRAPAPPPPQAQPQPQPQQAAAAAQNGVEVLREFANNWMECRDAQGIFYFNKLTKQSSDEVPPELRAPAPAQPSYAPPSYGQPSYVQQELQGQPLQQQIQQQQLLQQSVQQPVQQPAQQPVQQQQQQPQQQQPTVHMTIGDWSVCEDGAGVYYFHHPTGQSYDDQPPEVAQYLKAKQAQAAPSYQPSQASSHLSQMPSYAPSQAAQQKTVVQYQAPLGTGAPYPGGGGYAAGAHAPQAAQKQYTTTTYSQYGAPGYSQY